ncbi:hypothetical protein RFI_26309 [Reticulomyxa filosa]|uniref:Uncharacterized protein n=1 Tax=Reticulomyxa filosa TaxID=46433 RepID=X6MC99_RETFI|nr:hypothetical protein RFI_26309 [Reticulomyxa filosa]|eukprot:ETO11067.1 hypothetical protein RFI_26309 [Reticulomyxa filosa]
MKTMRTKIALILTIERCANSLAMKINKGLQNIKKEQKKKIMKISIIKQELRMRIKKDINNDDNDSRNIIYCSLHDKIIDSRISKVNTNFIN